MNVSRSRDRRDKHSIPIGSMHPCGYSQDDTLVLEELFRRIGVPTEEISRRASFDSETKRATKLFLKSCTGISTIPPSILSGLSHLQELQFIWCDNLIGLPIEVCTELPQLQKLSVGWCNKFVDFPNGAALSKMRNLRHLTLQGCEQLCDLPVEVWLLPKLQRLDIISCSQIDLEALCDVQRFQESKNGQGMVERGGGLSHLDLSYNKLGNDDFLHLWQRRNILFPALQRLYLSYNDISALAMLKTAETEAMPNVHSMLHCTLEIICLTGNPVMHSQASQSDQMMLRQILEYHLRLGTVGSDRWYGRFDACALYTPYLQQLMDLNASGGRLALHLLYEGDVVNQAHTPPQQSATFPESLWPHLLERIQRQLQLSPHRSASAIFSLLQNPAMATQQ